MEPLKRHLRTLFRLSPLLTRTQGVDTVSEHIFKVREKISMHALITLGSLFPHLEVFPDSLLSDTLGKHQPLQQLIVQGHLPRAVIMFLGNGLQDWLLQKVWAVFWNPENKTQM